MPKRGSSDSGAISRHLSKLSASFNGRKMQIYSGSGEETHQVLIMMATYMDRRAAEAVGDYSWAVFNQLNTGVRVIICSGIQDMFCRTQKNISCIKQVGLWMEEANVDASLVIYKETEFNHVNSF